MIPIHLFLHCNIRFESPTCSYLNFLKPHKISQFQRTWTMLLSESRRMPVAKLIRQNWRFHWQHSDTLICQISLQQFKSTTNSIRVHEIQTYLRQAWFIGSHIYHLPTWRIMGICWIEGAMDRWKLQAGIDSKSEDLRSRTAAKAEWKWVKVYQVLAT